MDRQKLVLARQILKRVSEDRDREETQTNIGLRLKRPKPSPPTVTRMKLRMPSKAGVDPRADTLPVPAKAPSGEMDSRHRLARAETRPVPGKDDSRDSSSDIRRSAASAARLIRRVSKDPGQPEWKRKLVKRDFEMHGTPGYAAPEQWHDPDSGPSLKGRVRITAKDPEKRESQRRDVAGTIANAAGRASHTCRDSRGNTYTSTMKCPETHTHMFSTQPTRTQRAMGKAKA